MEIKENNLRVPGANIYYQTCGSGPILFMVAGGTGDADSFSRIVPYLSEHYTVITYDRRGYSRSPLDDPNDPTIVEITTQSDDASRLLAAITNEPAYIFGSSLGALIGLDLALRHPEQVRMLVAHEPPLQQFKSKEEREADTTLDQKEGESPEETIKKFRASIGITAGGAPNKIAIPKEILERKQANIKFFLSREAGGVDHYTLDFDALKKSCAKIIFAGGEEGRDYSPYQSARKAAEVFESPLIEFPGHHAGYVQYPEKFVQQLITLFGTAA